MKRVWIWVIVAIGALVILDAMQKANAAKLAAASGQNSSTATTSNSALTNVLQSLQNALTSQKSSSSGSGGAFTGGSSSGSAGSAASTPSGESAPGDVTSNSYDDLGYVTSYGSGSANLQASNYIGTSLYQTNGQYAF